MSGASADLRWVEADWPAPGGVRALSTCRTGGVSAAGYASLNLGDHVGDVAADVAENRRRLKAAAGLPAEPAWLEQVHGSRVVDLDAAADLIAARVAFGADRRRPAGFGPADAAFTRATGRVCAILSADCLPVLLTADSGDLAAAAHAGWRGLSAGVIEATVQALEIKPARLMAWLGPAISVKHFEVGAEVREALLKDDPGAEAAFAPNPRGRFMADLSVLARRRLEALGVSRIYGGGQCTHADGDRYFSHRRDGVTGRQATLIWLEPRPG
ncbi:MAG TPA: peptidoglycan editing factor PgeF [Steroidobacteraceae bacterium]|nr:peptidoglycan editing factor PgeF [Steroidobacteraceae bacterium]